MTVALTILALIATVTAVSAVAPRLGLPAPLLLVVIGIAVSFLPFIDPIPLSPELVLIGLLPPLLYAAAIRTSLVDIKAFRRSIGLLAVGLVLFTTAVVGFVAFWLLPIPLAAAIAFGAVVAPPDAVAATAIARRIGLPRSIVTVLEGESLLNDATALVALRSAIAAIGGSVALWGVAADFAWAAIGGAAIGIAVGVVIALLRRRISDPLIDTALSLMAPFAAYLPAEEAHASGVIAVVSCGLLLGHKSPRVQSATSRLTERINWSTIQFLLENTVFLLIGLQVRSIMDNVATSELSGGTVITFCVATLLAVILVRPLWVFPVRYLLIRPKDDRGRSIPWTHTAVVSWAGMRGVVTLAAVFVLPSTVPHVDILVLAAFVVTAATLLIQGLTLPWLARRLGVRGPTGREDALQEAIVLRAATASGQAALDRLVTPADDEHTIEMLRTRGRKQVNVVWERLGRSDTSETPSETYRRLRLAMLAAERDEVLRIRDEGTVDSQVLADVLDRLDVEESMIDRPPPEEEADEERVLVAPFRAAGECDELADAPMSAVPTFTDGCPDCMREGTRWVHLRLCLSCGNVGCCDSSVSKHAERHFNRTEHPVMRSFEPGEAWRWCYVHEQLG